MFKAIVCDIDGTLLTKEHQLPQQTIDYLKQLQLQGYELHLVSGRAQARMQDIIDALDVKNYCIAGNGYKIFHTATKEEHIISDFTAEEVRYFFNLVKPYRLETFLFTETSLFYYYPDELLQEKLDYVKQHHLPENTLLVGGPYSPVFEHGNVYAEITRLEQLDRKGYKLCVRGDFEILQIIQKEMLKENCQCVITSSNWLEINPIANSKGNALKKLAEIKGYDLNKIIAFGDGENDLSMLTIVGYGYAMGNALDSVKQQVHYQAPTSDEQGVIQVLKSILSE